MNDLTRYIATLRRQIALLRDARELNRANFYEVQLKCALATQRGVDALRRTRQQQPLFEMNK